MVQKVSKMSDKVLPLTYCIYTNDYSLTTNLIGKLIHIGGFYYAITSLSLEEILGKVI